MAIWKASANDFTVDANTRTADGSTVTAADVWTADANHFTVDSNQHKADGWHDDTVADAWTADANHFTVDSITHKADGWHDDTAVEEVVGRGGGASDIDRFITKRHIERLYAEDQLILDVIGEFLQKAA